jgi:hypothetical protein
MKTIKSLAAALMMILLCSNVSHAQTEYDASVGLRAAWGFAVTGKKFISDQGAIEGIVNYRRWGFLGSFSYSRITITGLYQHHNPLDDVIPGLSWYYGGGAFVGFYGGSDWDAFDGSNDGSTYFGIAGNLGVDYAFEGIPLNISVDWIPGIGISGYGSGFGGEGGGVAVRYILQ